MRRPGYGKRGKGEKPGIVYPNSVFSETPWKYCDGIEIGRPRKVRMPSGIPEGGVFEAVFAFTDADGECYKTGGSFLYPVLCVALADGTVKELSAQAIAYGNNGFEFVNNAEEKKYSMTPGSICEDED